MFVLDRFKAANYETTISYVRHIYAKRNLLENGQTWQHVMCFFIWCRWCYIGVHSIPTFHTILSSSIFFVGRQSFAWHSSYLFNSNELTQLPDVLRNNIIVLYPIYFWLSCSYSSKYCLIVFLPNMKSSWWQCKLFSNKFISFLFYKSLHCEMMRTSNQIVQNKSHNVNCASVS